MSERTLGYAVVGTTAFECAIAAPKNGGIGVDEATRTTGEITAPSRWGHDWDFSQQTDEAGRR